MNTFLATTLEKLLNQALHLDPNSLQALKPLIGKIVRVELAALELAFTLFPEQEGIVVLGNYEGDVNADVQAPPFTLLNLLLHRQATLTTYPDVLVSGDSQMAQQLLHILQGLEIDWEEQLAQRLGDVPAHSLNNFIQRSRHYVHERLTNLQSQVSDYLQEEARHLPAPAEMETFRIAVETLRDDVDRLEQRVRRLQKTR